jgi:hypothetical protein
MWAAMRYGRILFRWIMHGAPSMTLSFEGTTKTLVAASHGA